jgi:DNA polymerase-1
MSENIAIAIHTLNEFDGAKVKELFEKRPWMEGKKFTLLYKTTEIEEYINHCIEKGLCALDLETTGLNTRVDSNGESCAKLVGVCMATSADEGVYIPVMHDDKDFNVPLKFILRELARLVANCRCIYHNFKFDGQVLRNYGIIAEDYEKYEDTMLMAAIEDASRKNKKLKYLVETLVGREMIEITQLGVEGSKKDIVAFEMVPPQKAVYYGASDGMCTYALYEYLKAKIDEQDPTGKKGPWNIYNIEKRCLFPTMEMERNLCLIDRAYLEECRVDVEKRMEKLMSSIYEAAGRTFDINSPKQLGVLLFEEMKIPYPVKEKTKSGQYATGEKVLELIGDKYPILNMILEYRGYEKILGTYIDNFLNNADENEEVKFALNQVRADTGRYSASGGDGLHTDGYSGVNCQNIPNPDEDNPDCIDLRRAVIAHPGYKILSVDYSGEELRVAANFSHEPKWIEEFTIGSADLHTKTAQAVTGKTEVSKKERKLSKTLNFHILYGGGAGGFAVRAKIPYETSKKMLINYFREYSQLKRWIDKESKAARERGYSLTALGRRRPLREFYGNSDPKIQAKGDRCAINSVIQGSSADIMKIALFKVWKWIHTNGLENDVRMLAPVHDEIFFEIKEEKLEALVPEICEIMRLRDLTTRLKWPVPLDVDAEYGDSWHVDHNFWEEHKEAKKAVAVSQDTPVQESTMAPEPVTVQPTPVEREDSLPRVELTKEDPGASTETKKDGAHPVSTTTNEVTQYYLNITVKNAFAGGVEKKEDYKNVLEKTDESRGTVPVFQDAHIKDRIDPRGYFNYPLEIDSISARKLKFILETLISTGESIFLGPKHKICVLSKNGEVYYRTTEAVAIDAFVALCLAFNI